MNTTTVNQSGEIVKQIVADCNRKNNLDKSILPHGLKSKYFIYRNCPVCNSKPLSVMRLGFKNQMQFITGSIVNNNSFTILAIDVFSIKDLVS